LTSSPVILGVVKPRVAYMKEARDEYKILISYVMRIDYLHDGIYSNKSPS
jgi:hypothetical protein